MIGEGSFGQVFKVVDQKNNSQVLAMKVEDEADDTGLLEREIKIMIELRKKQGFP
jgi:casein kinase I family protein HRR25